MTKIVYKVYEIREGLLKEPMENNWGHMCPIYGDYDSMEDACKAIEDLGDIWEELVVLTTVIKEKQIDV